MQECVWEGAGGSLLLPGSDTNDSSKYNYASSLFLCPVHSQRSTRLPSPLVRRFVESQGEDLGVSQQWGCPESPEGAIWREGASNICNSEQILALIACDDVLPRGFQSPCWGVM